MKKENQNSSRRAFLTASSVTAVSSVLLSGNSNFTSGFSSTNPKSIVFQIDPVTALNIVNVGLDVALKVKSLFAKDNSEAQIERQLADIQRQNTQIIGMLSDVLVILNNLGVTIRAGVRDEILVYIKGTLDVNFQRFYETWAAELDSPDASDEALIRYEELFPKFADLGRLMAKGETYGYAHFQTVGHAMSVEIWISRRLDKNGAFRRQAARKYSDYFEQVLNTNKSGSVAAQLSEAQEQAKRLDRVLTSADKYISTNPTSIVDNRRWLRTSGRTKTYAVVQGVISGDRNSGYRYSESYTREFSETEEVRGRNDGGTGVGRKSKTLSPDPVDTGDTSRAGRVAYWEQVRKVYLAALQDIKVLEKSKQTANVYLDVAKTTIANP